MASWVVFVCDLIITAILCGACTRPKLPKRNYEYVWSLGDYLLQLASRVDPTVSLSYGPSFVLAQYVAIIRQIRNRDPYFRALYRR